MIDYIIIRFRHDNIKTLATHLGAKGCFDISTGEILDKSIAKVRNLDVSLNLKTKEVVIKNSIHKFYHNGCNYKRFTHSEFIKAIKLLAEQLTISYESLLDARVTTFEFGINLYTKYEPRVYINDVVCFFRRIRKFFDKALNFLQLTLKTAAFKIKLYDKTKQHNDSLKQNNSNRSNNNSKINDSILRFELVRKPSVGMKDIQTLRELSNKETFIRMSNTLIEYFECIQFKESIGEDSIKAMKNHDRVFYLLLRKLGVEDTVTEIKNLGLAFKTQETYITRINKIIKELDPSHHKIELLSKLKDELNLICDFSKKAEV